MRWRTVSRKENSKTKVYGYLLSESGTFTVTVGDETDEKSRVPLNEEQYGKVQTIVATLSDTTKGNAEARAALIETLRTDGGMILPATRRGAPEKAGESIADLFAGIEPVSEESAQ
jgi:hypothetical protein